MLACMESRKMYWWTYLQGSNGDAGIENRLANTEWEGRWWDKWKEQLWNMYITICKTASEKLLFKTGRPTSCSVITLEGWDGEECEGVSRGRERMYTYGWFTLLYGRSIQYCKVIILQLRKNSLRRIPHPIFMKATSTYFLNHEFPKESHWNEKQK